MDLDVYMFLILQEHPGLQLLAAEAAIFILEVGLLQTAFHLACQQLSLVCED